MKGQFTTMRSSMAGIGVVEADTAHSFPRHMHDQFGIGIIRRGAQTSASGRGRVEAVAGDVITVNAGEIHDGAPIGDGGRCWTMLYVDPALIAAAVTDISDGRRTDGEFSRPVLADRRVAAWLWKLHAAVTDPGRTTNGLRCDETLLLLAARLIGDTAVRPSPAVPAAIRHARARIDDDPAAAVSLSDLAGDTGLSRFQLVRAFSQAVGMTPHAYLLQRRIQLARALMATGMPLAEVAASSGFADQSHMTRLFTRTYGLSPRAFADAIG